MNPVIPFVCAHMWTLTLKCTRRLDPLDLHAETQREAVSTPSKDPDHSTSECSSSVVSLVCFHVESKGVLRGHHSHQLTPTHS